MAGTRHRYGVYILAEAHFFYLPFLADSRLEDFVATGVLQIKLHTKSAKGVINV